MSAEEENQTCMTKTPGEFEAVRGQVEVLDFVGKYRRIPARKNN